MTCQAQNEDVALAAASLRAMGTATVTPADDPCSTVLGPWYRWVYQNKALASCLWTANILLLQ
jgi:hypothetical protein